MNVKIIAHTPDLEKVVASAAKLCYSPVGVKEISEGLDQEQAEMFLDKLMDYGHFSPLEHATFTFAIEGVSRVLTHQLVRHRIASYSQQSQRYVKLEQFEYITPPSIALNEEARLIFQEAMANDQKAYDELTLILEKQYRIEFANEGMNEKKARIDAQKKAIEDARFVFPNACETKIVASMNVRALMNFFEHRCCTRAQWEIKALADEMLKQAKEISPILFQHAGPPCVGGRCKEGKMSCGKTQEMKAYYNTL